MLSSVAAVAETCSLELKRREKPKQRFEMGDYLYWTAYPQRFSSQLVPQKEGPPVFQGEEGKRPLSRKS